MKVAVAGTGPVAQYLFEELVKYGHDVVVLTRKSKSSTKLEQRETNYTVESLVSVLEDRDALVSTVFDYSDIPLTTKLQLDMLAACQRSTKCKTYIPSEWTLNAEDYPEQPILMAEHSATLHTKLKRDASDLRWTIISNSWFADYVVPQPQRHLRDIGALWPMDHATKTFTVYGPGTQVFDVVAIRDVMRGIAAMLGSLDAPWEQYTYFSGQQLSWNELFAIIHGRDPEWKAVTKPLASTLAHLDATDPEERLLGHFELLTYSGASLLPRERVQRDRKKLFPGVKFRNVEEILDDAAAQPDAIL